jgi:hypothetical protein
MVSFRGEWEVSCAHSEAPICPHCGAACIPILWGGYPDYSAVLAEERGELSSVAARDRPKRQTGTSRSVPNPLPLEQLDHVSEAGGRLA